MIDLQVDDGFGGLVASSVSVTVTNVAPAGNDSSGFVVLEIDSDR